MAITNTKKCVNLAIESDDLIAKLGDLVVKAASFIAKLEQILAYMANATKDKRVGGYNGIWMNEKDKSAFKPLTNSNYFQVDIKEKNHHEMNKVLEKNEHLMQKQLVSLNKKTRGGNGCWTFSHSIFFYNIFVFCDVCRSMSVEMCTWEFVDNNKRSKSTYNYKVWVNEKT